MRALVIIFVVATAILVTLRSAATVPFDHVLPVAPSITDAAPALLDMPHDRLGSLAGPWTNLAVYGVAAILVGLSALPLGLVAALLAALTMVFHPVAAAVLAAGDLWPLLGASLLGASVACLSRRGSPWRLAGLLIGAVAILVSNLAVAPFLLIALAAGLGSRARPARVTLTLAVVALLVVGLIADLPAAVGWAGPVRLLGGDPLVRWQGAVQALLGLGGPFDWVAVGRLPVVLLVLLGVAAAIGLEEMTGRHPLSLVWAGPVAVAAAAASVTVTARSCGGRPPGVAMLLPALPLLALSCGAAYRVLVESSRVRLRPLSMVVVAIPWFWLAGQVAGISKLDEPARLVECNRLDPDLRFSAVMLERNQGGLGPGEAASRLEQSLLRGDSVRDLPPVSRVRVALECAGLYREAGDHARALEAARAAREALGSRREGRLADRVRAEWVRGRWLAGDGDPDSEIERIEADRLAGAESLLAAGEILLEQAVPAEPLGTLGPRIDSLMHRALTLDPESVGALVAMGRYCARENRLVDALRYLERAHRLAPDEADPAIRLSRLYFSQGEDAAGAEYLTAALRITSRPPASTFALGRLLYEATPDKERGIDLMKSALGEMPSLPGAAVVVATCQAQIAATSLTRGDADVAQRLASDALELDPDSALAHGTLGRLAWQHGDVEDAVKELGEAYRQDSSDCGLAREYAEALKAMGYKRLLEGEREPALELFRRLLDLDVDGIETDAVRTIVEGASTRPRPRGGQGVEGVPAGGVKGEGEGEEVLGARGDGAAVAVARAAFEEGMRLIAAGDEVGAEAKLRTSLKILPANPYACFHLGRIAAHAGRDDEALSHWRRAAELAGSLEVTIPELEAELGLALSRRGSSERKEAKDLLEGYLKRWPEGPDAQRVRAALEALRKAVLKEKIPW